ncbi:cupin [Sphingomonas sp. Leaf24]|uniref:cupin-like domain-containing protein n=1 Tax=unclassified Sphingomonas TaxID=196159 RepID=UPI0006F9D05D|nr:MULTISPECIES: cupin-like domain-containing protein [unclassified Sphingomonas]KQM13191.1 cupin [Sphingomonas sp. Leaf5]KQM85778.1 cupin [Sphingomonas sp. Leaf24]KQM95279.1 cupin [Sphingomonas sp. Leaf22]
MTHPRVVRSIEAARTGGWSPAALVAANEPVVLRGLAAGWPLVAAGRDGPDAAIAYLKRFDSGRPVVAFTGDAAMGGRFFYRDDCSGFNFDADRVGLTACLDRIVDGLDDPAAPAIYVGSTDLDLYLPGLRGENDLPWPAGTPTPMVSIWIGNRTTAATHYDMSNNLAACMVGRRRFTLFPPDQVANLYPGPLEPTPGGQVVSMVDLRAPDHDRFPRFAEAMAHAQVAELEPGDVLFYPALWWHNVEALSPFNAMINYWWNDAPAYADSPMTTLLHALLSLRDRPAAERAAWAAMFDHYVWSGGEEARAHLPAAIQGDLAPLDEAAARRLRARLLQRLNR